MSIIPVDRSVLFVHHSGIFFQFSPVPLILGSLFFIWLRYFQERKEREAQAEEHGWTVVVHHKGRKKTTDTESGVVVGSVATSTILDKMTKKKNKPVGLDFYRFQKREAHRSGMINFGNCLFEVHPRKSSVILLLGVVKELSSMSFFLLNVFVVFHKNLSLIMSYRI